MRQRRTKPGHAVITCSLGSNWIKTQINTLKPSTATEAHVCSGSNGDDLCTQSRV